MSALSKCKWASEGQSLNGPMGSVWAREGLGCSSGPARPIWPVKAGGVQWISEDYYCRSSSVESEWASKAHMANKGRCCPMD